MKYQFNIQFIKKNQQIILFFCARDKIYLEFSKAKGINSLVNCEGVWKEKPNL